MKKYIVILIILIALIGGVIWWNVSSMQKDSNNSNYTSEKISTDTNKNTNNSKNNNDDTIKQTKEISISNFSTKIYNKDQERQNNVALTCQTLTNAQIQPGDTFSFCETVGQATTDKGYQKADIFINGKKEQGIGGGKCQVSTTLYNAVLAVPELEVIERHEHSGHVPYIEDGKDAAVAYGTYDLKFKNNTQNTIKIVASTDGENIIISLLKIE